MAESKSLTFTWDSSTPAWFHLLRCGLTATLTKTLRNSLLAVEEWRLCSCCGLLLCFGTLLATSWILSTSMMTQQIMVQVPGHGIAPNGPTGSCMFSWSRLLSLQRSMSLKLPVVCTRTCTVVVPSSSLKSTPLAVNKTHTPNKTKVTLTSNTNNNQQVKFITSSEPLHEKRFLISLLKTSKI